MFYFFFTPDFLSTVDCVSLVRCPLSVHTPPVDEQTHGQMDRRIQWTPGG